ncbi:MAG: trehalose-6-phosphate synthase [Streptosporangiales bacterium]|nr:trehalose-6-phosphate synthase [Streptosporangiales bacterium]
MHRGCPAGPRSDRPVRRILRRAGEDRHSGSVVGAKGGVHVGNAGVSTAGGRSLLVVANRLPVDRVTEPDGTQSWRRSPGGLVAALEPVMRRGGGAWVGWSGIPGEAPQPFTQDGTTLVPVSLTARDVAEYYEGFSNSTLWPLYHDVIVPAVYERQFWDAYVRVNRRFAEAAAEVAEERALVWVQDYQLQLVPAMLRELRPDVRIGFFLHIPFPPDELFQQLPWRTQILEGLLGADLVGFQRTGAATNFIRLCRRLLGYGYRRDRIFADHRVVRAQAFPISVDSARLSELAGRPETMQRAREIRAELGDPAKLLLGVDRLDYTKGLRHRLTAFDELLAEGKIKSSEVAFVQIATPSRERVEQYRVLRDEIELQIGRINGERSRLGTPVVHYLHTSYSQDELVAMYCAADVMVVTPLRDGMNLVAKEYVACRNDRRGALVLSEFAGAAVELRRAFLVNPHDIDGLKETLLRALRADPAELGRRMGTLRRHVLEHDVNRWADRFLDALTRG